MKGKRSRRIAHFVNLANSICRQSGRGKTVRSTLIFEEMNRLASQMKWGAPSKNTKHRVLNELKDLGVAEYTFGHWYKVEHPLPEDPYPLQPEDVQGSKGKLGVDRKYGHTRSTQSRAETRRQRRVEEKQG